MARGVIDHRRPKPKLEAALGVPSGSQSCPRVSFWPKKEQEGLSFPLSVLSLLFRAFILSTELGLTYVTVMGLTVVLCWVMWLSLGHTP